MSKKDTFNLEERLRRFRSDEIEKAGGSYNIEERMARMMATHKSANQQQARDIFEEEHGYSQYRTASDFTAKSKATGSKRETPRLFNPSTWKGKGDLYDFINDINGYREHIANTSGPSRGYGDYEDYTNMRDDEIAMYNYLYNTQGREGAEEYIENILPELSQRGYEAREAALTKLAEDNPVAMSIMSVPTNFVGGVMGTVDLAAQNARRLFTGEPVNYYSSGMRANAAPQILRSTIGEDIAENTSLNIGDTNVAQFLYNTAMSGADSLAAGGFGKVGSFFLLGSNAAVAEARDIAARGGSDNQALAGGIAAGVFEGLFERFSLGNLEKMKEIPVSTFKDAVKNIAKSMGVNASEEAATEIANLIFDRINMGDMSTWSASIALYEAQGMDRNAARSQVIKDLAGQVAEAGISGGLMGFGFGGIGAAGSAITSRQIGGQIHDIDPLMQAAREMEDGSSSRKIADSMGENPSNAKKGVLYRTLMDDMTEQYMKGGMSEAEARRKAYEAINSTLISDTQDTAMPEAEKQAAEQFIQNEGMDIEDALEVNEYNLEANSEVNSEIVPMLQEVDLREAAMEAETAREQEAAQTPPITEQKTPVVQQTRLEAEQNTPFVQQTRLEAEQNTPFVERSRATVEQDAPPSFTPPVTKAAEAPTSGQTVQTDADIQPTAQTPIKAVATALDKVKEAGAVNLPYETVIASTNDIVNAGAVVPQQVAEAYKEGLAEYNNNQTSNAEASVQGNVISQALANTNVFKHDGLIYSLQNRGNGYYLTSIVRDDDAMGGMVSNARSNLYKGGPFTSRAEAIADIAGVYDANFANNKGKSVTPSLQAGAVFDTISGEKQEPAQKGRKQEDKSKEPPQKREDSKKQATEKKQPAREKERDASQSEKAEDNAPAKKAHDKLAGVLAEKLINKGVEFNSALLFEQANKAYGGTMAAGAYTVKDAYDALELAVNKTLLTLARNYNGNVRTAINAEKRLQKLLDTLPTQTKRTEEQQSFQQFSTPPNIAYLAAWVANIASSDVVLEPSAGIGGLAVFPKAWGATVIVNELSERRLEFLKSMGFDRVFNENAEQINNVLPDDVAPSVVIMNPPFSSTAGRTAVNKTVNATRHIEQALARLQDGGRLVAILGRGMSDNSPTFAKWWDGLREKYNIRANIGIDGSNYRKYGTTFDVQLVVIDKTGAQTGETVTGTYKNLTEIPAALEDIRNDRQRIEISNAASVGSSVGKPVSKGNLADGGTGTVSDGRTEGTVGIATDSKRAGAAPRAAKRNAGFQGGNTSSISTPTESANRGGIGESTSGVSSAVHERPELLDAAQSESQPVIHELKPARKKAAKSDNGIYAEYVPAELPVKNAKKHPAPLVESAAMAAVTAPKATYKPNLPKALVEGGGLSSAQLENIIYAGQAHQQTLPDGTRKGYFIGDGTGVGKGRQISGIILDNIRQGRNKAVWVSKNLNLLSDAQRDWTDIGQNKDDIASQASFKLGTPIDMDKGILFTGYDTLRSSKGTENRIQQIVDWLGKDFDGVIAFDEAHNMGNLLGKKGARGATKGSAKAQAGVELQKMLPNARIVYVSATGATDVNELAYAQRLGLWGRGTAFNDVNDFVSKIGSSGIAAMELVARDMKAMGSYLARSISYDGVTYDTLQHKLTPMQTEIYNTMSKAWQITMQNINAALKITNANLNAQAKSAARSAYYSAMQRFYNQVLTSMSMPSVIEDIKKELAAGHSCVLQIVNTNAAEQERQMAKIKDTGGDLDDMDLTPRGTLIGYLENSFPVYAYEEYTDENGKTRSRIVTDKNGKPVMDREALSMRNKLVSQINEMAIPDGPLEMLFDAFGTDAVAEVTGRGRRVVPKVDERGRTVRVEERRSKAHTEADIQSFQDGKKRILIFSDAGGTGKSYHADVRAKNQQKRIHYLVQPGWSASTATQGFGRSHRSNQATTPQFKLVTTNIMGQKRFVSTIARRLDQLGALTKGQRETGSGMFTEKDNLESALARDSLRLFYENLGKNRIEGVNGLSVLEKLGLSDKFTDEYGNFEIRDENVARDMNTFLNRILALEVDEQNTVFDEFYRIFETQYDTALENGTLDRGMENVKADKIEIVDDKVIRTDTTTGATTNYVQAKTYQKPTLLTSITRLESYRNDFQGLYKTDSGEIRAVYRIADKTSANGKVSKMFRLQSPSASKYGTWSESTLTERAKKLDRKEWVEAWKEEVKKAPQYDERTIHMLTGTLLPIWDKLPQEGNTRAMRITADDGTQYLGRVIPADRIDGVLRQLGSEGRTRETYAAKDVIKRIMAGETARLTRDHQSLVRKRVSGEYRIEITGKNLWYLTRNYPGVISEYINYENRYFIPTGEKGEAIIAALIKDNPIAEIYSGGNVDFMIADATAATDGAWSAQRVGDSKQTMPISDIINKMRHDFGIPVGTGRMPRRNIRGQYDKHAYSIKTRITNDLPTASHELGHHLDNVYGITRELTKELRTELIDQLSDAAKRNYPASKLKTEGFAEFIRRYMQNRETAKIDYPLFSAHFEAALDPKAKGMVDAFADEINAYYSLDADTAQSSIRDMSAKPRDFRTLSERISDKADEGYQAWVDSFHGIKLFDRAAGTNTYMSAINSAYADTIAYSVLTGDLTDTNGKRRGDGLQQALSGVNMKDKTEWATFGEYLVVKHGPERLAEGMRVLPDDRKNSTFWMNNRQAAIEQQYPHFKEASERLYEFQRLFLQVYGVETGLISAETAAEWAARWKYYVPFNRALDKESRKGARRGFANQNSTIRKARGSGADFINPVDNIINNMVKMVNAGIRNSVMTEVRNAAVANEGLGSFLEQVPTPMTMTRFSTEGLKQQIEDQITEAGLPETETNKVFGIINGIDDFLLQFKRGGKTSDNTVTVLVDGKQEYWKINDPLLLESLTNMSQKEVGKIMEWYGAISRLMTSSITGLNLIWSIGSNSLRDLGSLITYSQDKNLAHIFKGMARAYVNSFKSPDKQDALYKEFMAMGGGSESAYTADKNMTRDIKAKLMGSKSQWINPIQWIEAASNIIERGPRYATYKMMRDRGMTPQEAIYASHDITVNFRRGGNLSRQLNKAVPFFNAGVQGIDKLIRWLSCADVATENRAKAIRTRVGWYVAAYSAFGVLQWLINSRDDEDEKYYAQLSNYTKNNFWCIPVYEDGKHTGEYVTIPKPRELAMPSSLVSALLERFASENEGAFNEFDDYALGSYLPNVADDAVKGIVGMIRGDASFEDVLADLLGNLGIIGIAAYTVANRDFLGKPIESAYYENLERRDRYNDRTSKLAYLIGQAFNESPIKIDYVGQQIFGGFWKTQKALLPVNPDEADYTLGLGNTYRRDSQYSTDLVNNMYSIRDAAYLAHNSAPDDMDKAIAYKESNNMTTFYSRYNKLNGSTDTATRQIVLDMIDEYNWSTTSGERSELQSELDALCNELDSTEYMCAVMQPYIKDDNEKRHNLTAAQYVEFQGLYNSAYWEYVATALRSSADYKAQGIAVMQARSRAYDDARGIMLSRLGVDSEYAAFTSGASEVGLTAEDDILFQAALEIVDKQREEDNESLRKEDVYDVLESMDLTDEQREYLFSGLNYSGASNIYSTAEQLNEWIAEKREAGSADSSIASSITQVYKPLFIESWQNDDKDGMREIIEKLAALDLEKKGDPYYTADTFRDWLEDYIKNQSKNAG